MGALLNTPSSGQSEVLETLRYEGALSSGVQLFRLGTLVSHRWLGDENRQGGDATFEADLLTVVAALETAGYVSGFKDADGSSQSLQSSPPSTTRVVLTGAGRVQARAPRPRPRRISQ